MRHIIIFLLLSYSAAAQLSLTDCYKLAEKEHPLKNDISSYMNILQYRYNNLSSKWMPELQLFANAQYQSDVTKINLDLDIPLQGFESPEIPSPPKEQYKIGIQANQMIYDGGIISAQKDYESAKSAMNIQSVKVEIYKTKETVNELFFGILKIDEQMNSLLAADSSLNARLNVVQSAVKNGVMLKSNADILKVELIKIEQGRIELENLRSSMIKMLSVLIGQNINENEEFILPEYNISENNDYTLRPEFELFETTRDMVETGKSLTKSKYLPRVAAFFQGAYGQPGLNMFEEGFQPFYIVGIKASWNIWNWGRKKRELSEIEVQKELTNSKQEAFTRGIEIAEKKWNGSIKSLKQQIVKDQEIIELRRDITRQAASQLDAGVITSSEYLIEFYKEVAAKLDEKIHRLKLKQAEIEYLTLIGKINNISEK